MISSKIKDAAELAGAESLTVVYWESPESREQGEKEVFKAEVKDATEAARDALFLFNTLMMEAVEIETDKGVVIYHNSPDAESDMGDIEI